MAKKKRFVAPKLVLFEAGRPDSEECAQGMMVLSLFVSATNFNWLLRDCTKGGPLEALGTQSRYIIPGPSFIEMQIIQVQALSAICAACDKGISVGPPEILSHGDGLWRNQRVARGFFLPCHFQRT